MSLLSLRWLPLSLAISLIGCGGDDPFTPTLETVTGSYTASTFTTTTTSGTTNLLASGSTVSLVLDSGGSTTGRLFVPGGADGGGDLDADLTGTWALTGSTVTFDQSADTFIRDVEFTAGKNTLTTEATFSGTTIRLVLAKAG